MSTTKNKTKLSKEKIEVMGTVIETLKGTRFRVKLDNEHEIMAYLGMVWGISVRAKDMGQDCAMGCRQMTGGEMSSYTQLGDESRQRSIDRMLEMAARQGANGVINVEFELTGAVQGASQVVVHGTAVVIQPIVNYVPTGAVGNVLVEMHEMLEKKLP